MKCRLVMDDWRQTGTAESIYSTPLGVELSMGDMHSGTMFEAIVVLPTDVADEIETAWREHGAYPVLRLMLNDDLERPARIDGTLQDFAGPDFAPEEPPKKNLKKVIQGVDTTRGLW